MKKLTKTLIAATVALFAVNSHAYDLSELLKNSMESKSSVGQPRAKTTSVGQPRAKTTSSVGQPRAKTIFSIGQPRAKTTSSVGQPRAKKTG